MFYDAADGQARVLGGGFIKSALAASETRRRRASAPPFAARAEFQSRKNDRGGDVGEIDRRTVEKAYARWAPVYDLVFGKVFERGRRASIAAAERIGGRILEVGVGTGISLPDYARTNRLVGIDISEPMLRKAKQRVRQHSLTNVDALSVMDVSHLAFPDNSFDVVVAQYVITAVPDPEAALDEFARVVRPGGEIVLVNHIGAEKGMRRAFELSFAPVARRLGWRPEFPWARLTRWVAGTQEHARDRAPPDAADGAFLADPLRQDRLTRPPDARQGIPHGICSTRPLRIEGLAGLSRHDDVRLAPPTKPPRAGSSTRRATSASISSTRPTSIMPARRKRSSAAPSRPIAIAGSSQPRSARRAGGGAGEAGLLARSAHPALGARERETAANRSHRYLLSAQGRPLRRRWRKPSARSPSSCAAASSARSACRIIAAGASRKSAGSATRSASIVRSSASLITTRSTACRKSSICRPARISVWACFPTARSRAAS